MPAEGIPLGGVCMEKSNKFAWTWFVKEITSPGTYQITVSGGGDNIKASYTVIR
jgi:hypothetical protein